MTLRLIFLFFITALISSCSNRNFYSKNNLNYSFIYKDKLEENSKLIRCWLNYSVEKKGDEYIVKQYYYGNYNLTHYMTYSDEECTTLNGKYIEWYDNGNKRYEGVFKNGKAVGIWKYYSYFNGDYSEGELINGIREKVWKYYNSEHFLLSEYNYKNGKLHGPYRIYDLVGIVIDKGMFHEGELIYYKDESIFLDFVEERPYITICSNKPKNEDKYICTLNYIAAYLSSTTYYPEKAYKAGIEGTAWISVTINKNDEVQDIIVVQGLSDDIKEELTIRTKYLANLDWHCATQKNRKSNIRILIPFTFRIKK